MRHGHDDGIAEQADNGCVACGGRWGEVTRRIFISGPYRRDFPLRRGGGRTVVRERGHGHHGGGGVGVACGAGQCLCRVPVVPVRVLVLALGDIDGGDCGCGGLRCGCRAVGLHHQTPYQVASPIG